MAIHELAASQPYVNLFLFANQDMAGPSWEPTYYFTIRLESESQGFGIEAVAAVPASPSQVLIGRDLLSRWMMSWDGPNNRLVISY
jgi:hypothetical protein